ncbi:MAG: hypothetical protein JW780_00965 [Clostridiales bacterium]|nr:hypothetical protein [Clostridiales bacterium]
MTIFFDERFRRIGEKIRAGGMRISMHPGQYTVLNSHDRSVVSRAISNLEWHARFLDALGVSSEHKLILHVGGVYGDKLAAMKRFAQSFQRLEPRTRAHSDTIRAQEFSAFFAGIGNKKLDIMLEVKDKNLSAVKCLLIVRDRPEKKQLEREWARYKYWVMERSPNAYTSIRGLFK